MEFDPQPNDLLHQSWREFLTVVGIDGFSFLMVRLGVRSPKNSIGATGHKRRDRKSKTSPRSVLARAGEGLLQPVHLCDGGTGPKGQGPKGPLGRGEGRGEVIGARSSSFHLGLGGLELLATRNLL